MPKYNGTGPAGRGPGTGRGMGPCGGGTARGRRDAGRGQGVGWRRFLRNPFNSATSEKEEAEILEEELKDIKSRLSQIKDQK